MEQFFIGASVALCIIIFLTLYRAVFGPTVFDRIVGAGFVGTKTAVLLVIMVTGLASKDNVVEALRAGANHYIIRPVVQEKVIEIVNATISKYRAA